MIKSIKAQISILLEKKIAIIMFVLMMIFVLVNYFFNVTKYEGTYTNVMIQPMRLLFLSSEESYSASLKFMFLQFYPVLVVLPAGFFYASDVNSKMEIYLAGRMGKRKYLLGKLVAVFAVTFLVFTIPFLIEMCLNCLAFPVEANGNYSNAGIYSDLYVESVESYLFLGSFIVSPYLYAFVSIIFFGVASGILTLFTLAVSMFFSKYKVLLLLPVYVLLYGLGSLYSILPEVEIHTSHFQYFSMFDMSQKSQVLFILVLVLLALISVGTITFKSRRDTY